MAPTPVHASQVGSGKVTDSQVAFMVECYLRDSHFSRTLEEFRSEAARLLHPLRAVPKGARSLSAVLNDYVALKEEQISAAAEKARVEDLFHGLQEILSVYVSGAPKSTVQMGEFANRTRTSHHLPAPHVTPPAVTQQTQYRGGSIISESGNPSASADQRARQKLSTKRKCLDNGSHETFQQGDSTTDPTKRSRRVSTLTKRDPPPVGNFVDVDSPTGSMSTIISNSAQPATPPMSTISYCKPQQQQQQQVLPSAFSGSPQPSPSAEIRPNPVSPSAKTTPSFPTAVDCARSSHQDPQTPPPSSIKSSLIDNCTSASITASVPCETGTGTVEVKLSNDQQRQKSSLPQLSISTCPYALRAHKKPAGPPCALPSDAQLKCNQKATRKKSSNSKCRLLDFSAATEQSGDRVLPSKQGNEPSIPLAECAEGTSDSQQSCDPSAEDLMTLQAGSVLDLSPSSTQPSHDSEFLLPSDTFSFDELFDLDLDTSLISELEDLAAFTGNDMDPHPCPKSSDNVSVPSISESSSRGILADIGNFIHSGESASVIPQSANPSASPSKLRKSGMPVSGSESDKENSSVVEVSSSTQECRAL